MVLTLTNPGGVLVKHAAGATVPTLSTVTQEQSQVVSKIYLDFIPLALAPFRITGRVPVMQDIQVRICSVIVVRNDGETESSCHATRVEAESFANQLLQRSDGGGIKSMTIHALPRLIPNSPKRAWLQGVDDGQNKMAREFTSQDRTTLGAWSPETGWLFRDERAASRKPDATAPEEC